MSLEGLEDRITPATYFVDLSGDAGQGMMNQGDLRYCINQLNGSNDSTNTINFEVGGTIQLTQALPAINKNVTITGQNNDVQGSGSAANAFRIFEINRGVTAEIDDLGIVNGYDTDGFGGGILNDGNLTLDNDTVRLNETTGSGGGIYNGSGASLTISSTSITGNTAQQDGGGLTNIGGTVQINLNSSIVGNQAVNGSGGGIYNLGADTLVGQITCSNATQINGNSAQGSGGGVANGKNASFTMYGGSISNNDSLGAQGGGLYNANGGTVDLEAGVAVESNSAVNFGGGMYLASGSTTTLDGVTVQGNQLTGVPKGVGIYWQNGGVVTITSLTDNDDPGGQPVQGG